MRAKKSCVNRQFIIAQSFLASMVRLMGNEQIIKSLEAKAFKARVSITALCKEAGCSPATFTRWRKRPEMMRASTVEKMENALKAIESRKANHHGNNGKAGAGASQD